MLGHVISLNMSQRCSVEWWQTQAAKLGTGWCRKCGSMIVGVFVAPNRDGDCGTIDKCRTCGWEAVKLIGRNMAPIGPPQAGVIPNRTNALLRLPGPKRTRAEWMRIKGAKA